MYRSEVDLNAPSISLFYEGTTAAINPAGAYVESLVAHDGRSLIMPRDTQTMNVNGELRDRGGIPVCTPWFGPGELLGSERQHGFGRNLTWKTMPTEGANNIHLSLQHLELQGTSIPEAYKRAAFEMDVVIDVDGDGNPRLLQALTVGNEGHEAFAELSGFHPYFPLEEGADVSEYAFGDMETGDSVRYTQDQLVETQNLPFRSGDVTLQGPGINVRIVSEGLPVTFAWTDNTKGICLEPTAAGVADETSPQNRLLQPGDSRTYRMQITFLPKTAV